jgi:chromosomal replication initiator protein
MLIDIVQQYDSEKKQYFKELRTKVILQLSTQQDHKKIVTFLSKAWIINIEDTEKKVYIGFANDFMLSNAKKIFNKSLKETVQAVYNPQYTVEYIVYPPFSNWSDLLIDLWELLNIKPQKKRETEEIPSSIKNELTNYFWILLDPSFRFDNFIAWSNNQFAYSAAKAVAETPWTAYNPLFIYGNVWLGKTHLMQAIWNEINSNNPDKVIIYLPATKLIDDIILSIQKRNLSSLMRKFDNVDVLLIDDIQFLAWKDKTQEIFHNIFNDFHLKKKQIIFSSDRPPKELTQIEPRLKTRFALGLVADIQAPDYETRIAILQSKL